MGDLTRNINRKEVACKCGCGFDTADIKTVNAIQSLCDYYRGNGNNKVTIIFNCFCRCKKHNDALREEYFKTGGKSGENTAIDSQHIYGRGADIRLYVNGEQISPLDVFNYFDKYYPRFSIHAYATFTHVDSRTKGPARW